MKKVQAYRNILVAIFVCVIYCENIFAQYVPQEGEIISFLPVADKVRTTVNGFDCFYDGDKCVKNEKYFFKRNFRLNPNSQLLTPLSEIEGHKFRVLSQGNIIPKKSQNGFYMLMLERDDEKKVVMRIPFTPETDENILTKSMRYREGAPDISNINSIKLIYKVDIPPYSVSVPCYNVDEYEKLLTFLHKNVVVSNNPQNRDSKEYHTCKSRLYDICMDINKKDISNYLQEGYNFTIDDVFYTDIEKYNYKQILVLCGRKGKNILLPAFAYRSKGTEVERVIPNSSYSFFDFFRDEKLELDRYISVERIDPNKYIGFKVYYGLGKKYKSHYFEKSEIDSLYILEDGWYKCVRLNYDKTQKAIGLHIVLEDMDGVRFMVPTTYSEYIDKHDFFSQKYKFEECFMLEDEAKTITKERDDEQKKEQEELLYITQKYGKKYSDELKTFPYGREKFLKLVKKYNAETALQMVNKRIQIGWTYQMVRDSRGEPDEIYTSEYAHSYNEQWVYGSSLKTYLFFVNGKLNNITTVGSVE